MFCFHWAISVFSFCFFVHRIDTDSIFGHNITFINITLINTASNALLVKKQKLDIERDSTETHVNRQSKHRIPKQTFKSSILIQNPNSKVTIILHQGKEMKM
jgi:hypothetical protein